MFEPVCRENQLIINNDVNNKDIACLTLWTPREKVAKQFGNAYAVIGQLYSRKRGIVPLFINLLANPQIKTIHVRGIDLDDIKPFLKKMWTEGVEMIDDVTVECDGIQFSGIPYDNFQLVMMSTELVFYDNMAIPQAEIIHDPIWGSDNSRDKIILAEPVTMYKAVPAEDVVVIRGRDVFDVWVRLMDQIMRFGHGSGTHYDSDQLEIKDVITVIEDEDPDNLNFHPDFPFTEGYFMGQYLPTLLRPMKTDTTYNYGHRMMSYFGVNQVQLAIDKLKSDRGSRSVIINLWDSKNDWKGGGSPCLNHIWFRIENDHLTMVCTIRSNDMFAGYPENALALRMLQQKIRLGVSEESPVALGNLIIQSLSAHLYNDTFVEAKDIIDRNIDNILNADFAAYDIRGAFEITDKGNDIEVRHISPEGEEVAHWILNSINDLELFVLRSIPDPKHIMYLAQEIDKLDFCRRTGLQYKQGMQLWKSHQDAIIATTKVEAMDG